MGFAGAREGRNGLPSLSGARFQPGRLLRGQTARKPDQDLRGNAVGESGFCPE